MPLDPYSLCPGGRDKKIRFCCSDMIKEIEQIERLIESNQGGACLTFIESLEKDHPDCACLTAAKLSVYRNEDRWGEALKLSEEFLKKEPDNPVAAAEYSLALAVTGSGKQAISIVVDAFEGAKEGTAHSSLINAALQIGACLLVQGHVLPVVALGNRLKMFPLAQETANALLYRASSTVEIPLILRDMMFDSVCPDDFPAKTEFEDAIELLSLMRWKQGLARLESLTQYADRWPNIWRDVAAVRFWLLEDERGCEALRIFASLSNTPLEDAVDAETTRLFMSSDSLGDRTELLHAEYTVEDAEKILEILLSSPVFQTIDFNSQSFTSQNVPPPKGVFLLLDRPFPPEGIETTIENVSSQLATCLLFGKETDRPGRLELRDLFTDERQYVEEMLKNSLGDLIRIENAKVETTRIVSKTQAKIQHRFRHTPQTLPKVEQRQQLEKDYYKTVFAESWLSMPLGLLDGKTPREAATDSNYRIRLLGAIQMFEYWMNEDVGDEISNFLREKLNFPQLGPIVIPDGDEETQLAVLDDLPVWRWYRLDVEKLPTTGLVEGIQIVAVMKEPRATTSFAEEILNRPIRDMPVQARILAFESLIGIAQGKGDFEGAIEWIEKAKNESTETKTLDAGWLLHEIPIRLGLRQLDKAHEIINDIVRRYGHNEQVMQALQHLFVQLGLLNPDGTPSAAMQQNAAISGEDRETGSAAGSALWTPDSATGSASEGSASKLWTPD